MPHHPPFSGAFHELNDRSIFARYVAVRTMLHVSFDRKPSVILDTRAKVAAINGTLATKSSAESGVNSAATSQGR